MTNQLDALINQMIEKQIDFEDALAEFESRFIRKVLENCKGNMCKAAKTLGMHRNTLSRKVATLGLDNHRSKRRHRSRAVAVR